MKNNTFKRIAAGALATISVATNVMSANVGGSLFVDTLHASLIASAINETNSSVDFSDANSYLTSFNDGVSTSSLSSDTLKNISNYNATVGKTLTFNSSVPLNFYTAFQDDDKDGFEESSVWNTTNRKYYTASTTQAKASYVYQNGYNCYVDNNGKLGTVLPDVNTDISGYTFYKATNKTKIETDGTNVYEKVTAGATHAKVSRYVYDDSDTAEKYYKLDATDRAFYSIQLAPKGYIAIADGHYEREVFGGPFINYNEYDNEYALPPDLNYTYYSVDDVKNAGGVGARYIDMGENEYRVVFYTENGPNDEVWPPISPVTNVQPITKYEAQYACVYDDGNGFKAVRKGELIPPETHDDNTFYCKLIYSYGPIYCPGCEEPYYDYRWSGYYETMSADLIVNGNDLNGNEAVFYKDDSGDIALKNVFASTGSDVTAENKKYVELTAANDTKDAVKKVYEAPNKTNFYTVNRDKNKKIISISGVGNGTVEKAYNENAAADEILPFAEAKFSTGHSGYAQIFKESGDTRYCKAVEKGDNTKAITDAANKGKVLEKFQNNVYTYTIICPKEDLVITAIKQAIDLDNKGVANLNIADKDSFDVGSTVKISASEPFAVEINDNFAQNNLIKPKLQFDSKANGDQYFVEFTMPKSKEGNVKIKAAKLIIDNCKYNANNVKLTFKSKAKLVGGTACQANGTACVQNSETSANFDHWEKKVIGTENLKLPVDVEDLKNKSIDVTAALVDAQGNELGIAVTLSGTTTVNELNLSQPLFITYNDEQYSTDYEAIIINWQAVSKAKQFNIYQSDGETLIYNEQAIDNYAINVYVDEISDIQKIVESSYVLNNGDAKKISYEYSVGKGDKLESQEIDGYEAGFPKEIGEYSLYILYANESIAVVDLNVIKPSLHAAPTDAQLNITYGDKLFTAEELGYTNADGKTVKDAAVKNPDITIYATELLDDEKVKQIVDGKLGNKDVYEKDGKYYTKSDLVANPYNAPLGAGVYVAEIKAKPATTVGKADYTLMSDTFVLSVAKKQITADMIAIVPINYDGEEHTITSQNIIGTDTSISKKFAAVGNTKVKFKIESGEQTGTDIKAYTVNVTVDDDEKNYTGTVKDFKWYIIKGAEKDGENYSGLFWNDTETTIVDNGNINVEFGKSANLVGEVVEFGFIGDKSGKIGAPAIANGESYMSNKTNGKYSYVNRDADTNVQAAYKELVYGAGVTPAKQNAAMIAKKGADTFGVSVRIEDAETGVWVRPYLILKVDGEEKLYYGEVRYLNLVEEATAMLNLKASAIDNVANADGVAQPAFTKDQAKAQHTDNSDLAYMEDAKSGYWAEKNQFYAYAHYNFDKNSKVKDSAIQGFGVVLDKNGYIPALTGVAESDAVATAKAKEVLIPANKGKNGILSGLSKDNPKMLKNEMGVAVNPKDAVTGVWLRSFVDFGNGLIVYTDPVYVKSVSEQYAAFKPYVEAEKAQNAAKINYTVKANHVNPIPKYNGANAVIKEAGVVVDKNGSLFKLNDDGKYTGFVDDITTKFIAENATANVYNKGNKGIDINPSANGTIFVGHALQETNKSGNYIKTVARPFVVYTINGKDITIYGDPVVDTTGNTTYPQDNG